ncbi:hypothetical protein [Pseudorhodobacter sp.]|uniref:hypothetical protein n=1 Tax=Pseudorhodobacter sp. TaxID=1934400 RepID=UPI0026485243|nr:hypothetical protein [Pseudorhodobacter sp.]MDN5786434.1 hypothetical protein [Pseudorhodobacter sp.]
MAAGQAITLWLLGSGAACLLLLCWATLVALGLGRHRMLAALLLVITGTLAAFPAGLGHLRNVYHFPFSLTLFAGATLCVVAAIAVLWKMRRTPEIKRSADLGIAACLNLWLALWIALSPFSYL